MQDPRYKKLRQSLDLMRLPEHLNPDSVDLVDKLLNEYTRLLDAHNKLKKKANSNSDTNRVDVSQYEHKIDLLNEQLGKIMQENGRLKKKLEENGIEQKIMSLQSALNSCRIKYENKLDQMTKKHSEYEVEIRQLTISKNSLTDENQRIRSMLERSKSNNQSNTLELTAIVEKKKKQIQRLEQENSKYRLQVSSLQRIYNQQKQTKNSSQVQNQRKTTVAIQVLKSELAEAEQKLQNYRNQLQQERQNTKQLRASIKILTQRLGQVKNQQDYAKSSYQIETNAKQKYELMYNESQSKIAQLKEKIMMMQSSRRQNEEENSKLYDKIKDLENKNKSFANNLKRVQQQLLVLNSNFTAKVREIREGESQRSVLERRIKDLEATIKQFQQKGEGTMGIDFKDSNYIKVTQQYEKKLGILEKQIQITQTQLKIIQQNEHNILSQKSKLEAEVKKLQMIISQGNKQIEVVQMQKEALMKQNKEIKSCLSSTQTEGYTNKTQTLRLKQTIDQYEILTQDLQIALRNQQNMTKQLASKLSEKQKLVFGQQEQNKQMFEDNKQLKLIISSLEKTKNELFQKYKLTNEEKSTKQQDHIQYIKQYNKLLQENKGNLEKLRKKQVALCELSNQYDNLQNQLDNKTEQNVKLYEAINRLEKEAAAFNRGIGQKELNLQGQQNFIKGLQRDIEKLQNMYNSKCQEINDCQIELNRWALNAQTLSNEVSLLVKTNKQNEKFIEKEKLKAQDLERKIKDRLKENDELRQVASWTKIQNQALVDEIRVVKQEKTNIQNYSNHVVQQYNNLYAKYQQMDLQLRQLKEALQHYQFKQSQYVQQITHFDKQLRHLNEDLIKKDEELKRMANDRDVYRAEVNSSRRNYSNSTDWKIVYEQKIQALQNQFSLKRRQCENLRAQVKRYQRLIQEQREKNFYLEQEMKKSKIHDNSQTPIKMFYKSRAQSQNWDYNRGDQMESDKSISDKLSKNSAIIGESFESQKESLSSKHFHDNLDEIMKQYNKTITINYKKQKR